MKMSCCVFRPRSTWRFLTKHNREAERLQRRFWKASKAWGGFEGWLRGTCPAERIEHRRSDAEPE